MASSSEDCEPVFNILDSNYGDGDGFVPLARLQETTPAIQGYLWVCNVGFRTQGSGLSLVSGSGLQAVWSFMGFVFFFFFCPSRFLHLGYRVLALERHHTTRPAAILCCLVEAGLEYLELNGAK